MSHNMTALNLSDKEPSIIGIISTDQYRKWFTTGNLFNAADTDVNEQALHYITLDLDACGDEEQSLVFMADRLAKSFSATVQPFDIIDALASLTDSTDANTLLDKVTEMMFKLVNHTVIHLINDPAGYQFELSMPGMVKPKKVFTLWRLFEIVSGFDSIGTMAPLNADETTEVPMDKHLADYERPRTCPKVDIELGGQFGKIDSGVDPDSVFNPELKVKGYHEHISIEPFTPAENLRGLNNNRAFTREIKLSEFSKDLIGVSKAIAQVISEREAYIEYSEGAIDASISAIIRTNIDPIVYMASLDEVCSGREMYNDAATIIGLNLARVGATKDHANIWKLNGSITIHHSISNLLREALLLQLPPAVNQEQVLLEDAELTTAKP